MSRVWAVLRKVASTDNCSNPSRKLDEKNFKKGFFPVLDWFRALRESCISDQSCCNFLFQQNSRHLTTDLTINFACKLCDKFRACTIENWMVVSRDYSLRSSSHSLHHGIASTDFKVESDNVIIHNVVWIVVKGLLFYHYKLQCKCNLNTKTSVNSIIQCNHFLS